MCVCVREKYTLEQDIGETEEAIRHKSAEVQVRTTLLNLLMNLLETIIIPSCLNLQNVFAQGQWVQFNAPNSSSLPHL